MKKVTASQKTFGDDYDVFLDNLEGNLRYYEIKDIESAYNSDVFQCIPVRGGDRARFMPILEVKVREEEGSFYFTPSMILPGRIDGDELDFYDSFEYYMDGYVDAGKTCTRIFKAVYTPGMYSDD